MPPSPRSASIRYRPAMSIPMKGSGASSNLTRSTKQLDASFGYRSPQLGQIFMAGEHPRARSVPCASVDKLQDREASLKVGPENEVAARGAVVRSLSAAPWSVAKRLISTGKVLVDGVVVTDPGERLRA